MTDLLGRVLEVGDYVVFHNAVYEVLELPESKAKVRLAQIILVDKSKSTNPLPNLITCNSLCLLPKIDVMVWMLKKDYR